jgi:protein TonB
VGSRQKPSRHVSELAVAADKGRSVVLRPACDRHFFKIIRSVPNTHLSVANSFMKTPAILLSALLCVAAVSTASAARENPVPVRTVSPEYPRDLKASRVSGLVMVKCTIDEQGNVSGTDIVKSSNEQFDRFATDAVKKWKFKPAREDGTAITVQVTIPIKFVAEES